MHKNKGTTKNGERWGSAAIGMGRGCPLKTSPLPIFVTMSNFVVLHQRVYAEIIGTPKIGER